MKFAGQRAFMWEKRNAYRDMVGKHEGNRRLGRNSRIWDNVKMTLKEIG
jgi:hypothetical protein